jgi:hypothetical protein
MQMIKLVLNRVASLPLALPLVIAPMMIGCGGGQGTPTADTKVSATSGIAAGPSAVGNDAGLSAATVVDEGVNTEAAQSVAIFLDSLRRGDEKAANAVLTVRAREELAKTDYVIQPLGTPEGRYKIGRVGFPYAEKSVALVECTWTEPAIGSEPEMPMDIVCEVHQEAEGWRISGVGVGVPGTDQTIVLDFEDAASLQATIDAATGNTPAQTSSQASAGQIAVQPTGMPSGQMPTQPQFGLPQLPAPQAYDAQPTGESPPMQIALPQFNIAPVNR